MRTIFIHWDFKCLIATLALFLIYFICRRAELATMVKCGKLKSNFFHRCIISTCTFRFNMLFITEKDEMLCNSLIVSFIRCLILFMPVSVEMLLFTLVQKEKDAYAYNFELNWKSSAQKIEILHICSSNCVYLIIYLKPRICVHRTVLIS